MPFDTGVPPPKSKYHGMKFTLENLDIGSHNCPDVDNFEDDWFVSSGYEESDSPNKETCKDNQVTCSKLQKYTSQHGTR